MYKAFCVSPSWHFSPWRPAGHRWLHSPVLGSHDPPPGQSHGCSQPAPKNPCSHSALGISRYKAKSQDEEKRLLYLTFRNTSGHCRGQLLKHTERKLESNHCRFYNLGKHTNASFGSGISLAKKVVILGSSNTFLTLWPLVCSLTETVPCLRVTASGMFLNAVTFFGTASAVRPPGTCWGEDRISLKTDKEHESGQRAVKGWMVSMCSYVCMMLCKKYGSVNVT